MTAATLAATTAPATLAATTAPATLAATTAPAVATQIAHAGHRSHALGLLAPATFLVGLAVLVASVALDARDRIDRRVADAGVAVGVVCLLVGVTTLVV